MGQGDPGGEHQTGVILAIPGTSSVAHLEENVAAAIDDQIRHATQVGAGGRSAVTGETYLAGSRNRGNDATGTDFTKAKVPSVGDVLIARRVDGTRRPRRLVKARIDAMDRWLAMLREALEQNYDRLDQVLAALPPQQKGESR